MQAIPKQRITALPYLSSLWRGSAQHETLFNEAILARLGGGSLESIPLGRARIGLYLLVRWAVGSGRRKVVLSPCTIPDVVNMVLLAGGEPHFVDYRPRSTHIDHEQLEGVLDASTACVIVTHYHVNQASMPALRSLCAAHGALLFEDCAIAFGGHTDGLPIGGQTDASVFSFSAFKFLNFFWGGLITTRDPALAAWLRTETAEWRRLGYTDYLPHAKAISLYDFATRPIIFETLTFPRLQRRARTAARAVELVYKRLENKQLDPSLLTKPSFAAFAHWHRRLALVERQIAHRRSIAALYRRHLGAVMIGAETSAADAAGSCFVNFPIWVDAAIKDTVHREAMLAGYDLGQSLYPNVHDLAAFRAYPGRSQEAQRLVASMIYLPTHAGVSPAYAERLAGALESLLQRHDPRFLGHAPQSRHGGLQGVVALEEPNLVR